MTPAVIRLHRLVGILALALVLSACRLPYVPGVTSPPPAAGATLKDSSGRIVGSAVLLQESDGVRILLDVKGLPPGTKAVHIHEAGRCEPPSFESAGAHLNPKKAEHGTENPRGPHAGDLPNITVDATGLGHLEVTNPRVTLEQGPNSLFNSNGAALVVHEGPDDMRTDPAGNSGARIACGVIVRAG
jgi:superoxide dismutase, Cu-Zn family